MSRFDRRTFLRSGVALGGSLALGGPLQAFVTRAALAATGQGALTNAGYGPLYPAKDKRDGEVRLHLPEGFQYRSFDYTGEVMSDGVKIPGRHDGMAAFPWGNGRIRLVRNHEVNNPGAAFGDSSKAYDAMARGGTTTIELSAHAEHISNWVSINGTQMNCAGGATPWGSWLTCEETVNGPDVTADFTGVSNAPLLKPHGFVFEVPSGVGPNEYASPEPILAAGRFAHEAVDMDPLTGILYETEDNFGFPSGFYRYTPPAHPMSEGRMPDGGILEMLAIKGEPNAQLYAGRDAGDTFDVEWVRIDEPYPGYPSGDGRFATLTPQDTALTFVSDQGRAKGGASFSRLEGIYFSGRKVYIISTQGGDTPAGFSGPSGFGDGYGQVWMLDVDSNRLTLLFESPGPEILDMPDNVVVSPRGGILLCEDSSVDNFLRGLTPEGQIFDFAMNGIPGRTAEEFAGAAFSPNGNTLFVNIQASSGQTFAIWGPWTRGAL